MSQWREPITDRTETDITSKTAKAFFNVADWVRINGNTEQIRAMFSIMLFLNVPFTQLSEPTIVTIPTVDDVNFLIENVDLLRVAANLPPESTLVPLKHDWIAGAAAVAPNYADVNEWERTLLLLRDLLSDAADYFVYAGVGATGQPRFWQNRFREWPFYVADSVAPSRLHRTGLSSSGSDLTRNNGFRMYD